MSRNKGPGAAVGSAVCESSRTGSSNPEPLSEGPVSVPGISPVPLYHFGRRNRVDRADRRLGAHLGVCAVAGMGESRP